MEGIVDRIEGDILILEVENKLIELELKNFPSNIKEGDIVRLEGSRYNIVEDKTRSRKKNMDNLLDSLFRKFEE